MENWYAMKTMPEKEEEAAELIRRTIPPSLWESCTILRKKKLFPGYLFLISENLDELHEQLKRLEAMTKLLGAGDDIIALTQNEIDFLLRFAGDEELVKMSQGMIIGDKVVILSGPLKGMESTIQRIDRHKRKAWLNLEMFGRQQLVEVGVEIVKKVACET